MTRCFVEKYRALYLSAGFIIALLFAVMNVHAQQIKAVGLMAGTAILEVDGQTRMLKQGATSPEGIKLVSANSREAVIEVDGRRHTLGLSASLAAGYAPPVTKDVRLSRHSDGHYWAQARLNGTPVKVLVDTGASTVAMSSKLAAQLGINYREGRMGRSATAGGIVRSWIVMLNSVQVGDIKAHNVQASVIEGQFPLDPLLGMSFLQRLDMKEEAGMLVLSQ